MNAPSSSGLQIEDIAGYIRMGRRLTFLKLNHGFWDALSALERLTRAEPDLDPRNVDKRLHRRYFYEAHFADEMKEYLRSWPVDDHSLILALGKTDFPGSQNLHGRPGCREAVVDGLVKRYLPGYVDKHDSLLWKRAALDGSLARFFEQLCDIPIGLVGPPHLVNLGQFFGLARVRHIVIHPKDARKERWDIENAIGRIVKSTNDACPRVWLLQAGSLAVWLGRRLHDALPPGSIVLDMGRAIDICSPKVAMQQPWVQLNATQLSAVWGERDQEWGRCADPGRYRLVRLLSDPQGNTLSDTAAVVPFIPRNKRPDESLFRKLMSISERASQWTNGGPVLRLLEDYLRDMLSVPADYDVIGVTNGTAALNVMANAVSYRMGRPLRWAVPAFDFFSSQTSGFHDSLGVDCDERGQLSVESLNEIPAQQFDAVLATDVFGHAGDYEHLRAYCTSIGKPLVLDAAHALDRERRVFGEPEFVSFHHTKPWGVGEGGVIICSTDYAESVRALVNFGVGMPNQGKKWASNYKMSDIAAAAILSYLGEFERLAVFYRGQYRRVCIIAQEYGFKPLSGLSSRPAEHATPAFAALVASRPVEPEHLRGLPIVARKYYSPRKGFPTASDIFSRIVCVPTHPELIDVDEDVIRATFETLRDRMGED